MKSNETLLLACFEMGHQPLSLAFPLAALHRAGVPAQGVDLSIEPFPEKRVENASFIGIAVPMHTALRLGVQVARRVRTLNPNAHICFYGLYAWMNAPYLFEDGFVDSVIAGEMEEQLVDLVRALEAGTPPESVPGVSTASASAKPQLSRLRFPVPLRSGLPSLDAYARLMQDGVAHLAGYVETSRGCLHTCNHCPIVPVYEGRFFIVPFEIVMADIRQQVEAGARHITFGDPDFLNGPGHALKVTRALHAEFPHLTFDFTTKVEHIVQKRDLFSEFRELGAAFVVSAFESRSDEVLQRLEKGHTAADLDLALNILAKADIPIQPTWVPFTPWTTMDDYLEMLVWIRERDLIPHIPPVQYAIRLLVPPNSALLSQPDAYRWFGSLDPANFTHCWEHQDPRMDRLQAQIAAFAEGNGTNGNPYAAFAEIESLAYRAAGVEPPRWAPPDRIPPSPPRLTEDWFC